MHVPELIYFAVVALIAVQQLYQEYNNCQRRRAGCCQFTQHNKLSNHLATGNIIIVVFRLRLLYIQFVEHTAQASRMAEELTLQQYCFLYLAVHLGDYSVDEIGLLPLRLRRILLNGLPATDLCHLEGTPVASGIDMDEIWEGVCMMRLQNYDPCVSSCSPKDKFFRKLSSVIITDKQDLRSHRSIVEGIVSVKLSEFPFGMRISSVKDLPNCIHKLVVGKVLIFSERLRKHSTHIMYGTFFSRHVWIDLANLIVNECGYYPKYLDIMCDDFIYLGRTTKQNVAAFRKFTSCVEVVRFCWSAMLPSFAYHMFYNDLVRKLLLFVMEAILSSRRPQLRSLIVDQSCQGCMHLVDEIDSAISSVFQQGDYVPMFATASIKHKLPYTGLKSLSVAVSTHGSYLLPIINQSALESLHLEDLQLLEEAYFPLYSAIASVILQPQFCELTFADINLPFESAQEILDSFLINQTTHSLVLRLRNVEISGGRVTKSNCSSSATRLREEDNNKMLSVSSTYLPANLALWFFNHPQLCLQNLQVCKLVIPGQTIYGLLKRQKNLHINNLMFFKQPLPKNQKLSTKLFESLLTNPALRKLELSCCPYLNTSLTGLAHGLWKQAEVMSLQQLNLDDNEIGKRPESDIQLLLQAIFALPQLSRLALDLGRNSLTEQHISMLCDVWQEQTGGKQQLRSLKIPSFSYDVDANVRKVAKSTTFTPF